VDDLGAKTSHHVLIYIFWDFPCQLTWTFKCYIFESYWWETTSKWPKIICKRFGW